jgi:ABC-type transport system substrate-binding protein
LINKAAEFQNPTTRAKYYDQITQYLNTNYDFAWLWARPTLMIARDNVEGLDTSVGLDGPFNWEDVWMK